MLHGYMTLRRHVRAFLDSIGVNWNDINYQPERDEDGGVVRDDQRLEVSFRMPDGKLVELVVFAPSLDRDHKPDGKNVLPLGKVAARINGCIIQGPIDMLTWARIKRVINE